VTAVPWRLVRPAPGHPAEALARAEAVLTRLGPGDAPVLLWAPVDRAAVIVGRAAGPLPVDPAACAARGLDVVRRSSGGGPVLWDPDLVAFDVALPKGHPLAPDDVVAAYRWVGEAVAAALRVVGVPARVVGVEEARAAPRGPAAAACFGGLSPFEVVGPDGRKVAGLSQVRRRTGTLLQVGVPLRLDAGTLGPLLAPSLDPAALTERAAGVREWVPGLTVAGLVPPIEAAVAERAGAPLAPAWLTPAEAGQADALAAERFRPVATPPGPG
jgi:lipoate-protein ligase A